MAKTGSRQQILYTNRGAFCNSSSDEEAVDALDTLVPGSIMLLNGKDV